MLVRNNNRKLGISSDKIIKKCLLLIQVKSELHKKKLHTRMPATDLHLPICYKMLVKFSVEKYVLMSGHLIFLIYVYKLWRFCLSTCLYLLLFSSPRCCYSLQHLFQTVREEKLLRDSWMLIELFSTKKKNILLKNH
jgi:hypothetical protein